MVMEDWVFNKIGPINFFSLELELEYNLNVSQSFQMYMKAIFFLKVWRDAMKIVTWQNESLLPSSTLASNNITYFISVIYWRLICKHTCIPVSPRKCHKQYLVVTILYSVTKNNVLHTQCSYMIGERQSNECMELSSKSIYINIHRIEKAICCNPHHTIIRHVYSYSFEIRMHAIKINICVT